MEAPALADQLPQTKRTYSPLAGTGCRKPGMPTDSRGHTFAFYRVVLPEHGGKRAPGACLSAQGPALSPSLWDNT